jgi:tRNA threonylcarbamoyladenosine biosynthesis protein TsaE
VTVVTRSAAGTRALARRLARRLVAGDVIGLVGDLGSGKTTFVQGLAAGLGVPAEARVRSPTFTIANVYEGGRLPLFHVDLYRVATLGDLLSLGYEEYVYGDGVCAIEWLDRLPEAAPRDYLAVHFEHRTGNERTLALAPHGARAVALLHGLSAPSRRGPIPR